MLGGGSCVLNLEAEPLEMLTGQVRTDRQVDPARIASVDDLDVAVTKTGADLHGDLIG